MDSPTQSSFIPQDAGSTTSVSRIRSQGGLSDLILLLTIVLFVASLALAGAVFLYHQYLSTSAKSKVEQLQRAKEAFEPSLVHSLTRLDDRMQVADQILSSHIAPTAFFQILQQATLTTIEFTSLEFDALDPQRISIKMSGIAQSVNSIALQADLFSKNGTITNPIFSDINRQQDGVHFNLTALVNPASVNFVRLVNGLNDEAVLETVVPETSQSTEVDPFAAPEQTQTQTQGAAPSPVPVTPTQGALPKTGAPTVPTQSGKAPTGAPQAPLPQVGGAQ